MTLRTKPGPGVYRKYLVKRLRDREKKHARCEFFVLDLMHDPHASPALDAYASACEATNVELAADLRIKAADVRVRLGLPMPGAAGEAVSAERVRGFAIVRISPEVTRCVLCATDWPPGHKERHADLCPASPKGGTDV